MPQYYISSTKFSIQERETKKHGKVYDVVFRVITPDGREHQKKLSGFANKTLAKKAHSDFITANCETLKNNPLKRINPDKSEPTVGELITQYLLALPNQNKESSIYDKQNIYRLFVLPKYENVKLKALTKEELYRWQDDLWSMRNPRTGEFYSYKYLVKIRGQFSAFLAWCSSRYGYTNNLQDIDIPKRRTPKKEMKFWTVGEFEKFIEAVDDPMYHCLFTMLFYTGRRKGELFALSPDDIKSGKIRFDKSLTRKTMDGSAYKITSTKADKSQLIPICEQVQNELKNYKGGSPLFFGGETPLAENTVTRVFGRFCKKAGVETVRIHDLRHSFVSMCIHLGANYTTVAYLIGDTVEQVIKTYGHLYESDAQDVIARLSKNK